MKTTLCFALFITLLGLSACKKEKSIYEDACGVEPTADSLLVAGADTAFVNGNWTYVPAVAHVFIPNIFLPGSPLGFGAEDVFMVFGGIGVAEIESAVFSGPDGTVFYSKTSFLPNFYNDNGS